MTPKLQPPKTRIEQWSESALLATCARVAVVTGTPALLAALGWLLITTSQNTAQIASLTATVNGNLTLQNSMATYMRQELDSFEKTVKIAFDDHESRIRTLEHEEDGKHAR